MNLQHKVKCTLSSESEPIQCKVLSVLVPGYSYKHLAIQNGSDAVAMFVKMVDGKCTPEEAAVIRKYLLEYCKLDTLAMVKLHEQLEFMTKRENQ